MPLSSIPTYSDRAKSRLRENVRQATLGCTTEEWRALGDITRRTVAGELSFDEANDAVLEIRRAQRRAA